MAYDFTNLTERQQELLTYGGWYGGSRLLPQPSQATVRKLLDRGLLVAHELRDGALSWTEYEVPTAVHIAWCGHCSKDH